jgi:hypothetical protein
VLGVQRGYPTHDGNKAQWVGWQDLIATARLASSWRERLMPFVGPPGWHPPGRRLSPRRQPPADARIAPLTRAYVLVQFTLLVVFAAYLLWLREEHSVPFQIVGAGVILLGLSSLGGLLDGREGARSLELARLAASAGGLWLLSLSG